jgi:prolyl-tRNA synthetase
LAFITGKKSEGEKFSGALESYSVEILLNDGQCLQLATSHYFGENFCKMTNVRYKDRDNKNKFPSSTS